MSAWLLPLFAVASLFPRLFGFPPPLQQVQLTEVLFPLLLLVYRTDLYACLRDYRLFGVAAGCYVAANIASAGWAGTAGAMLEAGARAYLVVVAFLTLAYVRRFGPRMLERWWGTATVGVSLLGVVFYVLIQAGWTDPFRWIAWFDDYPYLGRVARLRGTAATYGMWVMLLLPGLLLSWRDYLQGGRPGKLLATGLILLAMLPTLSKELLLVVAGMLLVSHLSPLLRYGLAASCTLVLLLGTHYVIVLPGASTADTDYVVGTPIGVGGGIQLKETVYVPVHRAAGKVGIRNPWIGVGPGAFAVHSSSAAVGLPEDFGPFDPHSTWLGAFAESGLLGTLGVVLIVVTLLYYHPPALEVTGTLLLLFLVASVFKDVANYRGLWIVIGWYLAVGGAPFRGVAGGGGP